MSTQSTGLVINGKFYPSIKAVPLYRTVRTYTRHLGPEQHAVLGNLRWVLELSSLVEGEFFALETETDLMAAFNFEKTPQGFEYWMRIVKEIDTGRITYNNQRVQYKQELRQRKQAQTQQSQQEQS